MAAKRGKKTKDEPEKPVEKNGWTIYAHPLILTQIDQLEAAARKEANPQGDATKVLKWVTEAIFDTIPQDPMRAMYRQSDTMGKKYTHWFRDHYAGRFRLFFRFKSDVKVIVFAWVNDENSLRTYGATNDAYALFERMLDSGNPPDNWDQLLKACSDDATVKRLKRKRAS
jgi:toxin YhaV